MMKKLMWLLSYVLVALAAALLTGFLMFRHYWSESKLDSLEKLIDYVFIEDVDWEVLEDAAADAMVSATGDRWSYYIPASQMAAYEEQMTNSYVGVGITILTAEDGKYFAVTEVYADGPAGEAGMLVGDLLVAVDGEDIAGWMMDEVRGKVCGEEGTPVTLTIQRGQERMDLTMDRASVATPVVTSRMLSDGIGYILIDNFDDRCCEEVVEAVEALMQEGAQKLLFDVRNNPGGYANELVDTLDYLLPEGEVFHTVDYTGKEERFTSDASCIDLPMAVMVNSETYSAAEFFAAALQEYGAAVVLGEKTSGKGYFQQTYSLGDGSAVALSSGKYFTPQGRSLAGVGIEPDYEVLCDDETAYYIYYGVLDDADDPVLQKAIEVLNG